MHHSIALRDSDRRSLDSGQYNPKMSPCKHRNKFCRYSLCLAHFRRQLRSQTSDFAVKHKSGAKQVAIGKLRRSFPSFHSRRKQETKERLLSGSRYEEGNLWKFHNPSAQRIQSSWNEDGRKADSIEGSFSAEEIVHNESGWLDLASYLNSHVSQMIMGMVAVSCSIRFLWWKAEAPSNMLVIIPMSVSWTAMSCVPILALSTIATNTIKNHRVVVYKCHRSMNNREFKKNNGNSCSFDLEQPGTSHDKYRCIRCMSQARRSFLYCALYLPPMLAAISLVLQIISLFTLILTTQAYDAAVIIMIACILGLALIAVTIAWLLCNTY